MIASALRVAGAFRTLPDREAEAVARHGVLRRLAPDEILFAQGEQAARFFLVVEGRVKLAMITAEGRQVVVRVVGPGDVCGLALALARPDYPATCRALVETGVLAFPIDYWAALVEEHPRVALRLTASLGRHIDEMHSRMAELATEGVERRVAHAVLRLARSAGRPAEGGGVRIDFPLTRQDLAEMTGTTLHSVSRILSAWVERGLVRRGRARLAIADLAGLERIADGAEG